MNSKCVVLIPAYKPDGGLLRLLQEVCEAGMQAVVVDDGSGADYQHIFGQIGDMAVVLSYEVNHGKGHALKYGLKYIQQHIMGSYVVVTMDADGQHSVEDACRVCAAAQADPDKLVLGSRAQSSASPLRSRFGNAFTRGIFQISTGISVYDTQTGLRAFDSSLLPLLLQISGDRYEYEMNVLLECARRGVAIKELPIMTIYIDNNASSHFDSLRDSWRVCREVLKFSASSLLSFLVDYALYSLLLLVTAANGMTFFLPLANIVARIVSSVLNYNLNRRYVFCCQDAGIASAAQYFSLAAVILCGNTLVLSLLVGQMGIDQYVAKVLTEVIFFALSWFIQKYLIFGKASMRRLPITRLSQGNRAKQ